MRRLLPLIAMIALVPVDPASAQNRDAEPSVVGTWNGQLSLGGVTYDVTTTLRADGTYRSFSRWANYVNAETGKYTYRDGVLKTEPEGGFINTWEVTFDGPNKMKAVGGGLSISYRRQ